MAMDGFTKDMNIIQQLNDEPNDRDGLTAGELKAKFDEGGLALKDYLNNTVKPYVDGMEGTEAAHEADTVRHITAAERTAWNGKYDKTGGVLTGNVTVQRENSTPTVLLEAPEKAGEGRSRTILYKNASASADNGTGLVDYVWGDGTTANQRIMLRLRSSAAELKDRLSLIDYAAGGNYVQYHLYGEHNLPAVANITGLQAALDGKVDKVTGKGLSTNDYTNAEKNKLAGIAAGAQVNSITGVKGNAESDYRMGNVNLTPANIGALPLEGGTLTGNLAVQKNIPILNLATEEKTGVGRARAALVKNANSSSDSGTHLVDYAWGDGSNANERVTLRLWVNAAVQKALLSLIKYDAGGNGTTFYLYGEHNPPAVADVDGLQAALDGKSDTGHTHNYLPLTGGTLTGSLTMDPPGASAPILTLVNVEKSGVGPSRTTLRKNASATADYGTFLTDLTWGDGSTTQKQIQLVLRATSPTDEGLLYLSLRDGNGNTTTHYLYGTHNKPYVTAGQMSGTTLGEKATAEGDDTISSGNSAHAEGYKTTASGNYGSHAEGYATVASGDFGSHAEGIGTVAAGNSQHVFGKYNVPDTTSIEIVGGGTGSAPSSQKNIRTLATNGNEWIAGTLTQASDARLKDVGGEVPDVSGIRAVRFKWNDVNGEHDEKDHIGYIAQEVEAVAPYLVGEDSNGYKSLDYIALLTAKVEMLERQVRELTEALSGK